MADAMPYWEGFQVPVAWDSFREPHPVFPSEAEKGVKYYCPECKGTVQLRSGPNVAPHFYHVKPNTTCSGEGVIHQAAKALLLYWINSGQPIRVAYRCPRCQHEASYPLPFSSGLTAVQEYTLGPYRGDVVLVDYRGHPHGDLEILSSHPVGDQKANQLSVPWAELEAELVLKCPTVLWPVRWGSGWPTPNACGHCQPYWIPIADHAVRAIRGRCPRFMGHDVHEDICADCRFHQGIHEGPSEIPHVHCSFSPASEREWKTETAEILEEIKAITYRSSRNVIGRWPRSANLINRKDGQETVELTREQREVVNTTDSIVRVIAYAGTGKTFTLSELAKNRANSRILYLAFNKAVAQRASVSMPTQVQSMTAHALALRHLAIQYRNIEDLTAPGLLHAVRFDWIEKRRRNHHSRAVIDTLRRFWASNENNLTSTVLPDYTNDTLVFDPDIILRDARRVWEIMQDTNDDRISMTHDGYLKQVSLASPKLPYDVIVVDEAQDLTPALLHWILRQKHAQQVYVGDPLQAIYQFRGAINAMDHIPKARTYALTESFRFGSQIAALASRWINGRDAPAVPIIGRGPKLNRDSRREVILARTNWGVLQMALQVIAQDPKKRLVFLDGLERYRTKEIFTIWKIWRYGQEMTTSLGPFGSFKLLKQAAHDVNDVQLIQWCKIVEENGKKLPHLFEQIRNAAVPDAGSVLLTTIHRAKGLEFPVVILGDDLPNIDTIDIDGRTYLTMSEEDRNLWYVAVTRAQQRLVLPSRADYTKILSAKGWTIPTV